VSRFFRTIGPAALVVLLPLARAGSVGALCIDVSTAVTARSYRVTAGEILTIAFTHSIYGSRVEERFQIKPASFETVDVRYSEPRLLEFYGFESATRDCEWWVAHPARRAFAALALRASRDADLRISFGDHAVSLKDDAARVSLVPCSRSTHG